MSSRKVVQTATCKDIIIVARSDEPATLFEHRLLRDLRRHASDHHRISIITVHTAPGRKSIARLDIGYRAKGANRADVYRLVSDALWDNESVIVPPRAVISDKEKVDA